MVPPPNNTGDEFPDFDSMSPEEQMAWLESLARRQGAKPEEFTTAADLEIAEVSPDTVIDEPGYVPYSISEKEKPAAASPAVPLVSAEVPVEPALPAVEEPVAVGADELPDFLSGMELEAPIEEMVFPEADTDPMRWLGSLSAQTEADLPEPTIVAEEDTAEFLARIGEFEDVDTEGVFESEPEIAVSPDIEPVAAIGEATDPLGGMDPMLWLESLAKRQGANLDELTTSADLEIEEPPEGTVIDEPGYVPYDVVAGGPRKMEEVSASIPEPESAVEFGPQSEQVMEPVADFLVSQEPEVLFEDTYESLDALEESPVLLDGVDPMEWLESLAKRQGAKVEELTTSASLEIPQVPRDTVVDEPGYVAFSPFGAVDDRDEYEQVESVPEAESDLFAAEPVTELGFEPEAVMAADMSADQEVDESLAWLADLASEPGANATDLFGAVVEESGDLFEPEPVSSGPLAEDILAGMTDDEIAYAQAHGQLTPQQELEWLKRQAAKLADVRQESEEELDEWIEEETELAPASPGQLPSWLEDMRSDSEMEVIKTEGAAVFEAEATIDGGQADLGDWLSEMVSEREEVPALSFDSDIDSLWAEINDGEVAAALDAGVIADAADLFAPDAVVSEERDQLAEALDSEYERKLAGDDSEPEWYRQAIHQEMGGSFDLDMADESATEFGEFDVASVDRIETSDLTEAVPVDMPGWLVNAVDEQAVEPVDSDMPAWLTESLDHVSSPASTADMPDWLTEVPSPSVEDMGWLAPHEEKPAVAESPTPQPAMSVPQPQHVVPDVEPEIAVLAARPLPQGELFVQYRQRLERNPNDHATRLALARALRTSSELESSLDQYEALIEVAQLLPDIGADLSDLVREHENEPRIRRLLGDTYMRKGMLQEALDSYRSALNRL